MVKYQLFGPSIPCHAYVCTVGRYMPSLHGLQRVTKSLRMVILIILTKITKMVNTGYSKMPQMAKIHPFLDHKWAKYTPNYRPLSCRNIPFLHIVVLVPGFGEETAPDE
jgi:hypothetical protein